MRMTRLLRRRVLAVGLGSAVLIGLGAPAGQPASAATYPSWCRYSSRPVDRAAELLANRYLLSPHRIVTLPADPTWRENPLHDANWQFQYQAMRYVLDLFAAWNSTGVDAYRARALFLLHDWYVSNPRANPRSAYSWNDASTAFRAVVYACAADLTPMTTWLRNALLLHGRTLADPAFYVGIGNHALSQSIGLLEVGRVLGRRDWMTLARDRLNRLVLSSVDAQGVTNEQAAFYQTYNYVHYRLARSRLLAVGLSPGSGFARVDLMPRFLAQTALPNGEYEMIGDTEAVAIPSYPGTWTEFIATKGASGPTPPLVAAYADGYQFARTGWGTNRAFADETSIAIRWGPAPRTAHGHPDGTSVTLYAWGSRLLVGPGKYTFNSGSWRSFFTSRRANSVVTVDGLSWNRAASTTREGRVVTSTLVDVRLKTQGFAGVTQTRRITWSRRLGYMLVDDRAQSLVRHTYRQLWHLVNGANPRIGVSTVWTQRPRGNVLIRQLTGSPTLRVVTGATDPIQGWISYRYGQRVAAPVVQAIRTGTSVRYLTLIAPSEGAPDARVTNLRLTAGGYAVTITIGGRSERVIASGSAVSITPLN
ncbi:MAG TPA: heparinase II/III family protein [Candidatus Limnocylindrales bacterium]|nr:heparinase II/III family protein [Candidatus Limnocylindrales bacterium]